MLGNNKIDLKNNAFDFVRLLLALFVVFAHSRYLFGASDFLHWEAKGFDNLHAGSVGVWGFFAISGFLVTTSWMNSKNLADFLSKRFKRIFPGFWMSLLVCALVFAPIWYAIKIKTFSGFFDANGLHVWKFISNNFDSAIATQAIGSVANDSVNGPLWTIHHEVSAYIILGFIFSILGAIKLSNHIIQRRIILTVALLLSAIRIFYTYNTDFSRIYSTWFGDERFLLFLVVFMWGAVISLYKDVLVPHWPSAIISFVILMIATAFEFLPIVFPFCFAYLIISLCFALPFKNISKIAGDLSFGVYLYHWPVRLTLQMLGFQESLGLWSFLCLNIILTLPIAYLSWHLVEKRFLNHIKIAKPVDSEITKCHTPALN